MSVTSSARLPPTLHLLLRLCKSLLAMLCGLLLDLEGKLLCLQAGHMQTSGTKDVGKEGVGCYNY